jgi:hypothetical protein
MVTAQFGVSPTQEAHTIERTDWMPSATPLAGSSSLAFQELRHEGSRRCMSLNICNDKLVVACQVSSKDPGLDYEFRFSQKRYSARI